MKITEKKYKELTKNYMKSKKYSYKKEQYDNFVEYVEIKRLETVISDNNYEKFENVFLDFAEIHFDKRLNFSKETKLDLLKRSGGYCALCGTLTIFPFEGNQHDTLTIAAACHIHPASANGPRSDIEYRKNHAAEITNITNGLWACLNCHYEIDKDDITYTVDKLLDIKRKHEEEIVKLLRSKTDIKKMIENFEKMNDSGYIQVRKIDAEKYNNDSSDFRALYKDLKDMEKDTMKNASLFKTIKHLAIKRGEEFGDGQLTINMSRDKVTVFAELPKNEQDIEKIKKQYQKEIEENLEYDEMNFAIIDFVKKHKLVREIANKNETLEFFLVNKDDSQIVKIKCYDFAILEFEKFNPNLIRLAIENKPEYLYIDLHKEGEYGTRVKIMSSNINHFYHMFNFTSYLPDFNIIESSLIIKYNKDIYTINLGNLE